MAMLFALTIFSAAAVLFLLEPMIGKMLLPTFGGAPAVWNVCVAFFQATLLAAYTYADWLARLPSIRWQGVIHAGVVALPWAVLPFSVAPSVTPPGGNPSWALLAVLTTTVALPFFATAATSPLLSQWFATSKHRHASDPYYLYAASNAGSMLGLLAYPFLIEPQMTLPTQTTAWMMGYAVLNLLLAACITVAWRQGRSTSYRIGKERPGEKPSVSTKAKWVALSFLPSSLLLGVTAHLSTDVSPVPLIWVVPLVIYLLSFVLAFSRLPPIVYGALGMLLPILVLAQIYQEYTWHAGVFQPPMRMILIHLTTFFCAATLCHGRLATLRPKANWLTCYYFWIATGGVLGSMFNALAAPLIFNSLAEYPLAISATCLLSPTLWDWPERRRWLDVGAAVAIGLACRVVLFNTWNASRWPISVCLAMSAAAIGRPVTFSLVVAALFATVGQYNDFIDRVIVRHRNFYGVLTVQTDYRQDCCYLSHGRTRHGQQRQSEHAAVRDMPLSYYYPTGPIGQVFLEPIPILKEAPPIAIVGLGVGTLAQYGSSHQEMVFYEIDPAVKKIANDERYFTFLRDTKADCRIVLGDARLSLQNAPEAHYGLIVVDAFSGDAIPVHLLTKEAICLYLKKLAPGGILAFHISNKSLDLQLIVGNLADASSLVAITRDDLHLSPEEKAGGKAPSQWALLAWNERDFGRLSSDRRWVRLGPTPAAPLWTDHYTSLWHVTK